MRTPTPNLRSTTSNICLARSGCGQDGGGGGEVVGPRTWAHAFGGRPAGGAAGGAEMGAGAFGRRGRRASPGGGRCDSGGGAGRGAREDHPVERQAACVRGG